MNALVNATPNRTMSSREIAELTGSNHSDVKRSIQRLDADQLLTQPLAEFDFEHNGNIYQEYRLNKRDSILVVARISPAFTAAIIDRWQALENTKSVVQISYAESLRQLADSIEAKERAEAQLAIAAPKVDYYDKIVARENLLNASQVAQKLKLSAVKLNKLLDELGVYNGAVKNSRIFKQWFVDKGFGFIRQTELGYSQAMFTLRGEAWVVERLVSEGLA
jgi:phage regulator Rha-like protein